MSEPAVGHPTLVISYDPAASKTSVQGPLGNFALVDRMLCDARRLVTLHHLDARYQKKNGIRGATVQDLKELTG